IGLHLLAQQHGLVAVRGLPDQFEIGEDLHEVDQPAADQLVIVDDQDPDALLLAHPSVSSPSVLSQTTDTVVPCPGALSTRSSARTAAARSRMTARPNCPAGAPAGSKPRPSSLTRSSTRPGSPVSATVMRRAWACLAALVSASWASR